MVKLIVRILLVVIILGGGFFVQKKLTDMKKPPAEKNLAEKPLMVEAVRATYSDHTVKVDGFGSIRSAQRVRISPEVGGRVVYARSPLEAGVIVEKGELLFRIDQRLYKLNLKSAEAEISGLNAQADRIRQQLKNDQARVKILTRNWDLAKSRHERLKILFHEQKVGTLAEVEAAESAMITQENQVILLNNALVLYPKQLAEVEAGLLSARVRKEQADLNLEKTEIRAPFRGRLDQVTLEEGQLLSPNQAVLVLVDDQSLEIPLSLDSLEVKKWLVTANSSNGKGLDDWYSTVTGLSAQIHWTGASSEYVWPGIVDRVERFNPETRTVIVVIKPVKSNQKTPDLPLAEGMFCTVSIPARNPINCIQTPRTCVTHEKTIHLVRDDRLKTLTVELIHEDEAYAYIQGDLQEGDIIISTRLVSPVEGRLIQPIFSKEIDR